VRRPLALPSVAVAVALAGCGASNDAPISVGSTIAVRPSARCAERFTIDGTIVSVSGARVRVDIEDADGAGEGRIATVAPVRITSRLRHAAPMHTGRRIRARVRDCGSILVAERLLR